MRQSEMQRNMHAKNKAWRESDEDWLSLPAETWVAIREIMNALSQRDADFISDRFFEEAGDAALFWKELDTYEMQIAEVPVEYPLSSYVYRLNDLSGWTVEVPIWTKDGSASDIQVYFWVPQSASDDGIKITNLRIP